MRLFEGGAGEGAGVREELRKSELGLVLVQVYAARQQVRLVRLLEGGGKGVRAGC